jgi:hypothetical protein
LVPHPFAFSIDRSDRMRIFFSFKEWKSQEKESFDWDCKESTASSSLTDTSKVVVPQSFYQQSRDGRKKSQVLEQLLKWTYMRELSDLRKGKHITSEKRG